MTHRHLLCLCAFALALVVGCSDNATPAGEVDLADSTTLADTAQTTRADTWQGGQDQHTVLPSCTPDLDGQIVAAELAPALGVPVSNAVVRGDVTVDLLGLPASDGSRLWAWDWDAAGEQRTRIAASAAGEHWFGPQFAAGAFAVPMDVEASTWAVYQHDHQGLWLLGLASAQDGPARTLMIYDTPVQLYRFPLRPGDAWVSTGEVRNGTFAGLPYAGRDVYEVSVDAHGELRLPDLTFDDVLRVRTHVVVQPAVGVGTSRHQVSFLFECFGEVARATSRPDEPNADFQIASEIRRLAL